jgi:hypothetical protein
MFMSSIAMPLKCAWQGRYSEGARLKTRSRMFVVLEMTVQNRAPKAATIFSLCREPDATNGNG